jgi:AcrR family transcriptional regulator
MTLEERRSAARSKESPEYDAMRERILKAAGPVLQERGIHGANFGIIAKEAKIDRATIYYYFPDKFQLFREAVRDGVREMWAVLDAEAARTGSSSERLMNCSRALMGAIARHYPYSYVFLKDGTSSGVVDTGLAERFEDNARRYKSLLRSIIQKGIASGEFRDDIDIKIVVNMIAGMLNWTYQWFRPDGRLSGEEISDRMMAVVVAGLCATSAVAQVGKTCGPEGRGRKKGQRSLVSRYVWRQLWTSLQLQ